jgi:NAD(P)-dependent dehydrogenase (short-subunit alcohol dehydrogenase family)
MSWSGKTAVVTGVARPTAIGHACAQLLYSKGFNIIGIDLVQPSQASPASNTTQIPWQTIQQQQQQQQQEPRCVFLQVDLAQPSAIQAVTQQLQGLGVSRVKTLVNNAGVADPYMDPPAADGSNAAERAQQWAKYIAGGLRSCCSRMGWWRMAQWGW